MEIRKIILFLCLMLFLADSRVGEAFTDPQCVPPVNIIVNNGFERGDYAPENSPDGWFWDAFAGLAMPVWDEAESHRGAKSVKISASEPDDSRWVQNVVLDPNTPYYLSSWIKTEDVLLSPEGSDKGANISILGGYIASPGILGTQDWQKTGVLFNSEANDVATVGARLGFYSGMTAGTAWYDDVRLTPIAATDPHPRWKLLVLIYRNTDFTFTDSAGVQHHVKAAMSDSEIAQIATNARNFARNDIPELSNGNMLPKLTIRYPDRALTELTPNGDGWWPDPVNTALERDPAFDSVIVIWDPRTTDQDTGESIWIGSAGGLTLPMGTSQTYATIIVEMAAAPESRNVFKHEWGHSILFYFDALGTAPKPAIDNHAQPTQYVNCLTGQTYVWEDETIANPIPNSIYNNESGFTHDYYSGLAATAEEPGRCLGINAEAWSYGGPVTHSGNKPVYTLAQRIAAIKDQLYALSASGLIGTQRMSQMLKKLDMALRASAKEQDRAAEQNLAIVIKDVEWLEKKELIHPHAGELLVAALESAIGCR